MSRLLFSLLILVFAFSCNKKTQVAKVEKPEMIEEVIIEDVEEEVEEKEEVIEEEKVYLICELRRTSCYGKCPSYSIQLYSDGAVNYHGKANVKKLGHFTAYCSPQNFDAIFTAAEVSNYFVLKSKYPDDGRVIPDLPKTISYLKRNGLEKRIVDNFDAPSALIQFENWLDAFFDDLTWEKDLNQN